MYYQNTAVVQAALEMLGITQPLWLGFAVAVVIVAFIVRVGMDDGI